ncbi:MAG: Rpn family recombination-promoting nuclease/putative transposase [Treponema sp.]|jgi:predicted transposase/invertase (TIGR01784 family)|nr:Rpn family recombination-promoting nuclease/putative transposase [Treponema sp.]
MSGIRFEENDDLIDICLDNVFKAVFARDTPESQGALSRLLSAIIGRELRVVAITANEPPIDNLRDRQIRFDINCKGEGEEVVNVEMSLNPDAYEPVRLEFHAGKLFTGQDIRGADKSYDDLKEAYQIAILARGRFFSEEGFQHKFEYYDPERGVRLGGRSRIITLELSKLDRVVEKPVGVMSGAEQWGIFFRYLRDKSKREKINEILEEEEGIAMAGEVLLRISKDEVERARLMSEYKYVVDTQSKVVHAKREGRKEGLKEGRKEGKQEEISAILELINKGYSLEALKERLKADKNLPGE